MAYRRGKLPERPAESKYMSRNVVYALLRPGIFAVASLCALWRLGQTLSGVFLCGKVTPWYDKVQKTPLHTPANTNANSNDKNMEQFHLQPQQTSNETTITMSQQSHLAAGGHESSAPVWANLATGNSTADCSIDTYHLLYDNHFEQPMTFFSIDCLQELMTDHPTDISLKVGFFRLQHECQRRKLKKDPNRRHVVYRCAAGLASCGGMGDRMRAMLSSWYLALAVNATFDIDMESPTHWNSYFEALNDEFMAKDYIDKRGLLQEYYLNEEHPLFDLRQRLMELGPTIFEDSHDKTVINATGIIVLQDRLIWDVRIKNQPGSYWQQTNFVHDLFLKEYADAEHVVQSGITFRVQYFLDNRHHSAVIDEYRMRNMGRAERTHVFFKLFMPRPTQILKKEVEPYVKLLSGKYVIGMQVRLGQQAKGGWDEPQRHGDEIIGCMVEHAKHTCGPTQGCALWLTSDTERVLAVIQTALSGSNIDVVVSTGELVHLDRTIADGNLIKKHIRTFVDWYVMAEYSDTFLLSRSGFGEHASWFRLLNHTSFRPAWRFVNATNKSCHFEDFREVQNQLDEFNY
jgi:hypothetical protein